VKCLSQNEARWSSLNVEVLDFRQVPPFRSDNPSKATGVENLDKISQFLTPCKIGGGVCEMSE